MKMKSNLFYLSYLLGTMFTNASFSCKLNNDIKKRWEYVWIKNQVRRPQNSIKFQKLLFGLWSLRWLAVLLFLYSPLY